MAYWIRSATLQIGSKQYSLDDLHFSFTVPFTDNEELTTADIEVINLSESSRRDMRKGDDVILNAGYEGDIGVVFVGQIANMSHKKSGTEWTSKIQAIELMKEWSTSQINKTHQRESTVESITTDMANNLGVEMPKCDIAQNTAYTRGKNTAGRTSEKILEVAGSDGKSRVMTREGKLYIMDPEDSVNKGILLSPSTGLLQCDEDLEMTPIETDLTTQSTNEEKSDQGNTKKRSCLLNYRIGATDQIMFQSKTLNGRFRVVRGTHKGNPTGDWITEIEVIPV